MARLQGVGETVGGIAILLFIKSRHQRLPKGLFSFRFARSLRSSRAFGWTEDRNRSFSSRDCQVSIVQQRPTASRVKSLKNWFISETLGEWKREGTPFARSHEPILPKLPSDIIVRSPTLSFSCSKQMFLQERARERGLEVVWCRYRSRAREEKGKEAPSRRERCRQLTPGSSSF